MTQNTTTDYFPTPYVWELCSDNRTEVFIPQGHDISLTAFPDFWCAIFPTGNKPDEYLLCVCFADCARTYTKVFPSRYDAQHAAEGTKTALDILSAYEHLQGVHIY